LVAVFEPRTNTSKRAFFQELYVPAFLDADLIVLREPRDTELIRDADRFSSLKLAEDIRRLGKKAQAFTNTDALIDFLSEKLRPNDVALIMSNGNFDNLSNRLLEILKERNNERSLAV
jgi:UDP-N-acetylmuramate: L-alanyl-gamma-D-glutamyl-meso-diaminopimelate ligase